MRKKCHGSASFCKKSILGKAGIRLRRVAGTLFETAMQPRAADEMMSDPDNVRWHLDQQALLQFWFAEASSEELENL